jgi:predicted aspartyl protease
MKRNRLQTRSRPLIYKYLQFTTIRYTLLLPLIILSTFGEAHAVRYIKADKVCLNILGDKDSDPTGDFKIISVPLKRAGNLLIVQGKIDTLEGSFVLDTGAPDMVLNAAHFSDVSHLDEQDARGVNGISSTFSTTIDHFSLGIDLHYDRLRAHVLDLSFIEKSKNIKLLGLLGTRIFSKLAITIDVVNNLLYIHKLNKKGLITAEEWQFGDPDIQTELLFVNDAIFINGRINDKSLWFAFDTGAEINMIDLNASKRIIKTMMVTGRRHLTGVGGARNELLYARFDKLNIGGVNFDANHVVISNLRDLTVAYGRSFDAILGCDFFSRGIFTLNFARKEFKMYMYRAN